jgi:hypothetical protein
VSRFAQVVVGNIGGAGAESSDVLRELGCGDKVVRIEKENEFASGGSETGESGDDGALVWLAVDAAAWRGMEICEGFGQRWN